MIGLKTFLVAAVLAAGAPVLAGSPPAAAQEADCTGDAETIDCNVGVYVPGERESSSGGSETGGSNRRRRRALPTISAFGAGGNRAGCGRSTITGEAAQQQRSRLDNGPSGATTICGEGETADGNPTSVLIVPEGQDAAPAPPTPQEVAADLLLEVQGRMHRPEVVMDPPVGTASIISLPVFVQVTNWVDGIEEEACEGPVCVSLTAEPTLTFDPGEPGSSPVECEPPGTRFDPNGPDPEVQAAAPGACAHVYQYRTGADDRPDAWPATVNVTWEIAWEAAGQDGTFPAQTLSTSVPREVDEVQTVVRDGTSR